MKFNLIHTILIGGTVILASCSKSYLTRTPYNAQPYGSSIKTVTDLNIADAGMYSELRTTDLYGRTLPIKGDLMGDNTYVTTSNSGRYITLNTFNFNNADQYATAIWQNAYITIKYANSIINSSVPDTNATIGQYIGEAYAVRALMHFELVRNFGHPYTLAPDDPGVPIVLKFDSSATPARNTVREVYTQVISDLEKAYTLMTIYRGTAYFSKYAARALEARVYQNMGDWPDALTTSMDVITSKQWTLNSPTSYVAPSGSLSNTPANSTYSPGAYWATPTVQSATKNETMFEVASDLANNNGTDQIGNMYLQLGGGYGDVLVTDTVYNLYSATDVRKGLCVRGPAFYRASQAGNVNLCYKYPNAAGSGDHDDTKVLRYSDVLLIAAEAYYNANDMVNANLYLNMVAKQRDPSYAGWNDAGPQVLEDILIERRKELAFEGSRFWDLVRLGRSWTKITNQSPLSTISVAPGNNALIFPIPVIELNANPNIKQNPGY